MTAASGAQGQHSLFLKSIAISKLEDTENILQSEFWGRFRTSPNWTPLAFYWEFHESNGRFLLLLRRFHLGLKFAYIPYGPRIPDNLRSGELSQLLCKLAAKLRPYLGLTCLFVRFDLALESRILEKNREQSQYLTNPDEFPRHHIDQFICPLHRAPRRVQPQNTVILKLGPSEEQLLANMHRKTRYNIRLAARKGVVIARYVGQPAIARLSQWYRLYRQTAARDRISVHSLAYYKRLFEVDEEMAKSKLSLYFAEHRGDILAGIIVVRSGNRTTYMYGASGALKREMMPNYLLQWHAIRNAKIEGAGEYDFFGIPPSSSPNHPMHGLWRFKMGFGGKIACYLGAWDYSYMKVLYQIFCCAEKMRGYFVDCRKAKRRFNSHAANSILKSHRLRPGILSRYSPN